MNHMRSYLEHTEPFSTEWIESTVYPILSKEERNHIQKIDEGRESFVLIVQNKRVFKFPRAPFSIENYDKESEALLLIADFLPTAVPKKVAEYGDKRDYSSFFIEYEHMSGTVLRREDLVGMPEVTKEMLGREIGKFLYTLHSIPTDIAKILPHIDMVHEYRTELDQIRSLCFPYLDVSMQTAINELYEEYFELLIHTSPQESIIHNDFGHDHVYREDTRLTGVLDWGRMQIGDPALDWRWRDGPRAFDSTVYQAAMNYYSEHTMLDPGFLKRVNFYNEKKPLNRLLRICKEKEYGIF